jgi:acyl carrier protein
MCGPVPPQLSLFFLIKVTNRKLFVSKFRIEAGTAQQIRRSLTVLDHSDVHLTDRVARLVRRILDKRAITRTVDRDDDLRASGLSSLDIVNLMLAVETEFAIKVPEREMTPANFRSIARIAALVAACQEAALF